MADGSLNPLLENGSPAAEHSPGTGSRPGTARSARPSASSVNRNGKGAGPVHFPDEADADGNPCMRGIDRCDEALGVGTAPNWQQVGAGRGSYEVVETLVYVGEGKGNYNKEELQPVKNHAPAMKITWQRKLYMSILCSLLFAGAISLMVSLVLGPGPLKRQVLRPPAWQASASSSVQATRPLQETSSRTSASKVLTPQMCHQKASTKSWSRAEDRQFCCSQLGLGCPDLKCQSGRDDWQHAWSPGKKIWCCEHHHVGCAPKHQETGRPAPEALPAPPAPKDPGDHGFWRVEPLSAPPPSPATTKATPTPTRRPGAPKAAVAEPFHCTGDSKGWPDKQQEWCCWHYGTGCPPR